MELLIIAIRNVFRNRRRSILNIIALTVGISIMFIATGWIRGYFTVLYDGIINAETGHIQLVHDRYIDESRRLPLDLNVGNYATLREELETIDRIKAATGRINFTMKLSNGRDSLRMMGRAIHPRHEQEVTVISEHIVEGSYLTEQEGVLIGAPAAEKLEIETGDTIFITARDRYGVENFIDAPVVGLYELGYPAADNHIVFMDLETARFLLSMENEVTKVVVKLEEGYAPEDVLPFVERAVENEKVAAFTWQKFAQTLVSAVKADMNGFIIMLIIIYLLILLGILNSMSMSVHERVREIGTLRAIGMKKRALFRMFILESFAVAVIASIAAFILGGAIALYIGTVGFDFAKYVPADMPIPFGNRFTADFRWYDFVFGIGVGTVTAVLGGLLPARRAARYPIAEAMGSANLG